MNARRVVTAVALAAYAAFVLVVTLSPRMPGTGFFGRLVTDTLAWLHAQGLLLDVEYDTIEFLANIGMFIPLGLLAALLVRSRWVVLAGPAFSLFIELYQGLLLPSRVGEWRDLLSNSIGFVIGVWIGVRLEGWRSASSGSRTPRS